MFGYYFKRWKSTVFEIFRNTAPFKNTSNNIDFDLWGKPSLLRNYTFFQVLARDSTTNEFGDIICIIVIIIGFNLGSKSKALSVAKLVNSSLPTACNWSILYVYYITHNIKGRFFDKLVLLWFFSHYTPSTLLQKESNITCFLKRNFYNHSGQPWLQCHNFSRWRRWWWYQQQR